ncbi:hypothetical protein [Shouchella clausii]|uniref:hypothetical protein n=1 Tax=Shouchella clausii TaxID=79880 RepID=UPI001C737D9D|nr:hypothetical protein [Shouchella clausii]MBX0320187.1 hypothetical protein [Shouchella clausii]
MKKPSVSVKTEFVNTQILEIAQKNKTDTTVKEIIMLVHKLDIPNGNGLEFSKETTQEYMSTLIDKPVVCKYYEDIDDLGTHEPEYDPETGHIIRLNTISVGSITDVWIDKVDDDSGVEALYAKATIWSYKYPEIARVILEHFENNTSNTSVEVEIYEYGKTEDESIRQAKNYTYLGHCILGSTVMGADPDAAVIGYAEKQIAQAVGQDISTQLNSKEGELKSLSNEFNKGFAIQYHGTLETNSLKFSDVEKYIYNVLNPIDPKTGDREYNYFIRDLYTDHVIVESWNHYDTLYKIPYTVLNDSVTLESKESWEKGVLGFVPSTVEVNSLIGQVKDLQKELDKKMEVAEKVAQEAKKSKEELQNELQAKETKINELNEFVTQQEQKNQEEIKELNSKIEQLTSKVAELEPYKSQVEEAEKAAKITELNERYAPLLGEELMASDEVKALIEEAKEIELNKLVVEKVMEKQAAEKDKQTEINSSNDDLDITPGKQKPLAKQSLKEKYDL